LHAYLLENGIYLGPSGYEVGFVSNAHTYEQLDKTAIAFANGILLLNN
jgi:glutamate-1-semialdehyde 2,1-aminomutase